MSRRIHFAASLVIVAAALSTTHEAAAWFPGFPPMPSTRAQWWGYGYGPGHHAPMLHTPGAAPAGGPRNIHDHGGCALTYPAPYAPIGCYGGACGPAGPASYSHPEFAPEARPRNDRQTWR